MADEEALLVVVGIEEPAGDALRPVAAHFAGVGMEDIDAENFHLELAVGCGQDLNIGLAEDNEQIALPRVL